MTSKLGTGKSQKCKNCGRSEDKHFSILKYCYEAEYEDFQGNVSQFSPSFGKCLNCKHEYGEHVLGTGHCDWLNNELEKCKCKKFTPEDENLKPVTNLRGSSLKTGKEKKGCGREVHLAGLDCGEIYTDGRIQLCPSCSNQSPRTRDVNSKDKSSGDEQIPNGEQNSPSGDNSSFPEVVLRQQIKENDAKSKDIKTLSSKRINMSFDNSANSFMYPEKDVKDFITKLKGTMLIKPSPKERGKFILWLAKEIDSLAGERLTKWHDQINKEQENA